MPRPSNVSGREKWINNRCGDIHGYMLTMEDDDDEEDFETLVYGQCEADQDAAS